MIVTGKETAVSVIEVKSLPSPDRISTSSIVITAQMETNAGRSYQGDDDSISIFPITAAKESRPNNHENIESCSDKSATVIHSKPRNHTNDVPSSSLTLPELGVVGNGDKPKAKQFKSLLDQLDDSSSAYTQGGIYLGGSVVKSDQSD